MTGRRSPFHHTFTRLSIPPSLTARSADTTGTSVDRRRRGPNGKLQWFDTAMLVVVVGDSGDQQHTFTIEHSDDNSTWETAPADVVQGDNIVLPSGTNVDNESLEQGYVGHKRYLRAKATFAANGGLVGAAYSATFVLDQVDSAPTDR